jgi:hypothetical protein
MNILTDIRSNFCQNKYFEAKYSFLYVDPETKLALHLKKYMDFFTLWKSVRHFCQVISGLRAY